jgi:hypothetical protein
LIESSHKFTQTGWAFRDVYTNSLKIFCDDVMLFYLILWSYFKIIDAEFCFSF